MADLTINSLALKRDDLPENQWTELSCSGANQLQVNGTVNAAAFKGDGSQLTGVELADGSVGTATLADNTVTSAKIAKNAVAKQHIQNDSVAIAQLSAALVFDGQVSVQGKQATVTIEQTPPGFHRFYFISLYCIAATFPPGSTPRNVPVYLPVQLQWKRSILAQPVPLPAGSNAPIISNFQQLIIENPVPTMAMTVACKIYRLDEI